MYPELAKDRGCFQCAFRPDEKQYPPDTNMEVLRGWGSFRRFLMLVWRSVNIRQPHEPIDLRSDSSYPQAKLANQRVTRSELLQRLLHIAPPFATHARATVGSSSLYLRFTLTS